LVVVALIGVSQARRNALVAVQRPVPNDVQIQGLVDTGASNTCVDPFVLNQLGLTPTGTTMVNSPTTGAQPVPADTYDVSLTIYAAGNQPPLVHHTIPVLVAELLAAQGIHALIGRDILRGCLLTYDGANGLFSMAY
jgi:predicted aspartyl protease